MTRLSGRIRSGHFGPDMPLLFWIDEAAARAAARDAGIDTIAVRCELRDGDEVLAEASAWWGAPSHEEEVEDLRFHRDGTLGDIIVLE